VRACVHYTATARSVSAAMDELTSELRIGSHTPLFLCVHSQNQVLEAMRCGRAPHDLSALGGLSPGLAALVKVSLPFLIHICRVLLRAVCCLLALIASFAPFRLFGLAVSRGCLWQACFNLRTVRSAYLRARRIALY
jgi:hypothetical protein